MSLVVKVVNGSDAAAAWAAYLRNRSRFGPDSLRQYAHSLPSPDRMYLILPAGSFVMMTSCPAEWGNAASGVLLLGPPVRRKHRSILLIHVRTHMHGGGQGTRLISAAQEDAAADNLLTLSTSAEACRTWYATLLLLRNNFTGDQNLRSAFIRFPTVTVPADAVAITFTWEVGRGLEEQIRYVEGIRLAQRNRKHDAFADALTDVLQHLASRRRRIKSDHRLGSGGDKRKGEIVVLTQWHTMIPRGKQQKIKESGELETAAAL